MSRRTPLLRGDENGTSSMILTFLNTLVIVGLVVGVIVTGVFVGDARGDVNTLTVQTSNVTEFTPQVISFVDTPDRFNETTVSTLYTAVVKTSGFCVTLTNFSSCTLMGNVNMSYTPGPAPSPGPSVSFRVSNVFPDGFGLPNNIAYPPMQSAAVIIDSVSNTTLPTLCSLTFVDAGVDVLFLWLLPIGIPDNTVDNSVICWSSQFMINYIRPK